MSGLRRTDGITIEKDDNGHVIKTCEECGNKSGMPTGVYVCEDCKNSEKKRKPRSKAERLRDKAWDHVRQMVLDRDDHECQICGFERPSGKNLHVHHILPRNAGGSDKLTNLVTLCEYCHCEQHSHFSVGDIAANGLDYDKWRARWHARDRGGHWY